MGDGDALLPHYARDDAIVERIADALQKIGKDIDSLTLQDLAAVDEFHVRGRQATLELASRMKLGADERVLDIGSGLGGPARTVAEAYGCNVTGVDLSAAFCNAARTLSKWVGLGARVSFQVGDAIRLPFADRAFDASMTLHTAMNVADKPAFYAEARRVLKPGGILGIYDVLKGEGGGVLYPVPWAREPSTSHLATPAAMRRLIEDAGFGLIEVEDSTERSTSWFERFAARSTTWQDSTLNARLFLGGDFHEMTLNQVRNLAERRIRTVAFICEA